MTRCLVSLVLAAACLSTPAPASAGWHEFWYGVKRDFHRMNCWPEPFVHWDRADAVAPFEMMIHSGWRARTTLGEWHFHPETQQLTRAGQLHLNWILVEAPPQYRTVFVLRGETQADTARRLDAVQQYVAQVVPQGELPAVVRIDSAPLGRSAEYIDAVDRRIYSTIPDPRLPSMSGN